MVQYGNHMTVFLYSYIPICNMYILFECVIFCGTMIEREEYVQLFTMVQMKPEHDIM